MAQTREQVITGTERGFHGSQTLKSITTVDAVIDDELRQRGFAALTASERRVLNDPHRADAVVLGQARPFADQANERTIEEYQRFAESIRTMFGLAPEDDLDGILESLAEIRKAASVGGSV